MRIRSRLVLAVATAVCLASASAGANGPKPRYSSVADAREQGISAYGSGYIEMAVDPLEYAAAQNDFLGQYYLARIYSDNSSARTDHAKAYMLYQRLADAYADLDPDDDRRAPFVAKTLTALAGYLRSGLSEIGLKPDLARAAEYLHHAASFFNDEDAQFQLSKLILEGALNRSGVPRDQARERLAANWLSTLTTERRMPSAQAFLAYLMWRGEHEPLIRKDPQRALALVTVAAENAPPSERIWIEDYYQEIYCGISAGNRKKLDGMVASYRQQYSRTIDRRERSALGGLVPEAERTCRDGEAVPPIRRPAASPAGVPAVSPQNIVNNAAPPPAGAAPFARGSVLPSNGLGLIDAGATGSNPTRR